MTQSRIILPERAIATPHTQEEFLLGLQAGIPVPREAAVEFRLLGGGDKSIRRSWGTFTNSTPQGLLLPTFPPDRNIFYGVALRKEAGDHPGAGSAENCHASPLLCVDLDLKTAQMFASPGATVMTMSPEDLRAKSTQLAQAALLRSRELEIEVVALVYTGHGVQLLFALPAAVPHKERARLNRLLCEAYGPELGADPKVGMAAQMLRLPGTQNVKNPDRPLLTELWGMAPGMKLAPAALETLTPPTQAKTVINRSGGRHDLRVRQEFNLRFPHPHYLEQCGYKKFSDDRYTRPGDGASGGDVRLLRNNRGVLCSFHHSANDPVTGTSGDGHLREPFDLYRDLEHGGDIQAAVATAARLLGERSKQTDPDPDQPKRDRAEEKAGSEKRSLATRLVDYAYEAGVELWHDRNGDSFLTAAVGDHHEHHRLPSRGSRDFLQTLFYRQERRSLPAQALSESMSLLGTMGRVDGPQHATGLRTVHHEGHTFLDLGDRTWRVVSIGPGGWRVIPAAECPVRFTRSQGMLPLPVPVPGGSLDALRPFLNTDRHGFMLCIAWLVAGVSGMTPYPLLALSGEEGTGKSTAMSVLRRLIDPHKADRRRAPRDEQDLFIGAQGTHVIAYDNLSTITTALSDAFCVLSTGGAFTTRTLFSDSEETILEASRPIAVNGIPDLLARPDLAERALAILLHRIAPEARLTEAEFWERYGAVHPELLGALLTALSGGLARLPTTQLKVAPRLADFARLIVAAEPGLPWQSGEFLPAYTYMQTESASILLDGEPVADAIRNYLDEVGEWTGTVSELREILTARLPHAPRPPEGWPTTAKALGVQLRRLAAALNKTGYVIRPDTRHKAGRRFTLRKSPRFTYTTVTDLVGDVQKA